MSNFNITSRYALALTEIAEEKNIFSQVVQDVELVYNSLVGSKELRNYLSTPIISELKKIEIINEIFASKVNDEVHNFLKFVVKKGRVELLSEILKQFLENRDKKENITDVNFKSPYSLDDVQKENAISQLEKYTGKKIRFTNTIDESLIGGYVAKIKDEVIDASVKRQLEKIKYTLVKE